MASAMAALRDAAVDAVQALALTGVPPAHVLGLQTLIEKPEDLTPTLPAVILAPYGAERLGPDTNLSDRIEYPLAVLMLDKANGDQDTGFDKRMVWRESVIDHFIRNRVTVTLPTGCFLLTQEVDTFDMANLPAWVERNTFLGGLVVRFVCRRRRRAA